MKPDWRIAGGFEAVVALVEGYLRDDGHLVERISVDAPSLPHRAYDVRVPDEDFAVAREWFNHLAMTELFASMDLSDYDLVVSTQPPSYAVQHPRQLAVFYHHLRAYYDLASHWVAAGFAAAELHEPACRMLREVDAPGMAGVSHFLAGSPRVVERLRDLSGVVDRVSTVLVPAPGMDRQGLATPYVPSGHVLCVGRHEFTKRTELVIAAGALMPERDVVVTGVGSRQPHAQALSSRLHNGVDDALALTAEQLWLNRGEPVPRQDDGLPNVRFAGRVSDAELASLYAGAACVVSPSYDEDYGLTALEAMRADVPVVVCRDGGGLLTFVEDGVTGVVAEPTPAGIAAAVRKLLDDPSWASRIAAAGRDRVSEVTHDSAAAAVRDAVERVMSASA